ncbi:hypothetical protein [Bordetella bronchiseptica]|uniref:hypothetical protein n=1 Tax=Bordetella bronchiseptica TaxID=518 RepID=UPI00130D8B0F|nr:hypothetical protein [Bordetella bronchiseptica]
MTMSEIIPTFAMENVQIPTNPENLDPPHSDRKIILNTKHIFLSNKKKNKASRAINKRASANAIATATLQMFDKSKRRDRGVARNTDAS